MIIVHIQLGTGNQLFQYAYARALAEKRNDVYIDCSSFAETQFGIYNGDDVRSCTLNQFRISLKQAPMKELAKYKFINKTHYANSIHSALSRQRVGRYCYISDKRNAYCEDMFKLPSNCYIEGWFQDEGYFKHIREELLREIVPKTNEIPMGLINDVENQESVAIHVRRGDFLFNGMALNSVYYNMAISEIRKKMPNAEFYVFTDDFRWVRRHLDIDNCFKYVNEDRAFNEANELFLMSKCKSMIASNSTFSWWGAWLNNNSPKKIIAPKIWCSSQKTIVPNDWLVL